MKIFVANSAVEERDRNSQVNMAISRARGRLIVQKTDGNQPGTPVMRQSTGCRPGKLYHVGAVRSRGLSNTKFTNPLIECLRTYGMPSGFQQAGGRKRCAST